MRKPIQISIIPENETTKTIVIVLCDDGTLWETWESCLGRQWSQIIGLPQGKVKP